ncbi:MAG: glutaredoxin [Nanoarchaeota archaeon]|nr:glutaredoxin [Nanoarchaeota archaeon]
MKFKVYTKSYCPYCTMAKELLKDKGYEFEEIELISDEQYEELKKKTGHQTVPQIFCDDKFVGGYDDLCEFLKDK